VVHPYGDKKDKTGIGIRYSQLDTGTGSSHPAVEQDEGCTGRKFGTQTAI